ncbi:cytochrome P460 [Geothermobacter ehrlichii]|uniref:Cytochrome P460 n=1 Tax=Geothermobacter ehrlichii TaxID=213224 RepID=A0A5D3WHE6_9BACT|nr:cytochrome P460 family protein [Geothermobacter ehrlichii]TYO98216.1 cytochrome P460 [Geothermobacter ehrlichii]
MRMSRMFSAGAWCLVLVLLAAAVAVAGGMDRPAADGKAVWRYIHQTEPYQQWPLFPGKEKLYKGRHPHGAFLTTYVSPDALAAIEAKKGMLPNGAFVVKENYTPEKKLAAVTVMYRVEGYDSEAGDWFWAKYAPDGKVLKEGKVKGCIQCHQAVISNDWIFTGPVK